MREQILTLKSKIAGKLPLIILIYMVLQPLLDVAGYWQVYYGTSNAITMAIRMLLLAGSILVGFFLSDRKWVYIAMLSLLAVLTGGHVAAHLPGGYNGAVEDVINLVRIYLMPLTALCFITFLRQGGERVFSAIKRGMVINLILIALVQLISTLTGTDPYTYEWDRIGVLGWFIWTNSQSTILAMLCPIMICWALQRWKTQLLPVMLMTAISEITLYLLAPRLAYASLVAGSIGVAVSLLLINRKRWKQCLAIVLVTVLFVAAYPISPTHARLNANNHRTDQVEEDVRGRRIDISPITRPATSAPANSEQAKKEAEEKQEAMSEIEKLYRSKDMWSMVDRFGIEKVAAEYDYSLDPEDLMSNRKKKIVFCTLLMKESNTLSHLFGLNINDMCMTRYDKDSKPVVDVYDVENDFHGVYYLTGIIGIVLMVAFLLYFGLRALLAVIRDPKRYFTLDMASFAIAYVLALIHAGFTASVLRRNNASVYLAIVLAVLWYLSRRDLSETDVSSGELASNPL